MVEAKPALLHLFGQTGQSLIDRWPVAEMLQAFRLAITQRLLQMEPSLIVDVVVEVDIDSRGSVVQQKPARLRQRIAVGLRVNENGTNAQRGFQQAFYGIIRQVGLLRQFLAGHTFLRVSDEVEDAEFNHQT